MTLHYVSILPVILPYALAALLAAWAYCEYKSVQASGEQARRAAILARLEVSQ